MARVASGERVREKGREKEDEEGRVSAGGRGARDCMERGGMGERDAGGGARRRQAVAVAGISSSRPHLSLTLSLLITHLFTVSLACSPACESSLHVLSVLCSSAGLPETPGNHPPHYSSSSSSSLDCHCERILSHPCLVVPFFHSFPFFLSRHSSVLQGMRASVCALSLSTSLW